MSDTSDDVIVWHKFNIPQTRADTEPRQFLWGRVITKTVVLNDVQK